MISVGPVMEIESWDHDIGQFSDGDRVMGALMRPIPIIYLPPRLEND